MKKPHGKRFRNCLLLILLLSLFLIPAGICFSGAYCRGYDSFSDGDYAYSLLKDGTAVVSMYYGKETRITVPAELGGHRVTAIGSRAFDPDHGAIIDPAPGYADKFFAEQKKPRGVESITLPEGVTKIYRGAFWNCTGLMTLVLPSTVTDLGTDLFDNCYVLSEIRVSPDHPFLTVRDGILYDRVKNRLLSCPPGLPIDSCEIPSGTESIGDYAFSGAALSSVVIPETVTSIGEYAFSGSALTSLRIPESVAFIGDYAFESCKSLVHCELPANMTAIPAHLFYGCKSLTSVTIPGSVTSIGDFAFGDCASLQAIDIPDRVTEIGRAAFIRCTGLTSFRFPSGVTTVAEDVFFDCENLTDVYMPDTVRSIQDSAFRGCRRLAHIEIPEGVTSLGDIVFFECDALSSVRIPASVRSIGNNPFEDCLSLTAFDIPEDHPTLSVIGGALFTDSGRRLVAWPLGLEAETYEVPQGTQVIGERAFAGCRFLSAIRIPASVTSIEDLAFYGCKDLTFLVFRGSYAELYCEQKHLQYTVLRP